MEKAFRWEHLCFDGMEAEIFFFVWRRAPLHEIAVVVVDMGIALLAAVLTVISFVMILIFCG